MVLQERRAPRTRLWALALACLSAGTCPRAVAEEPPAVAADGVTTQNLAAVWAGLFARAHWVSYDAAETRLLNGYCRWDEVEVLEIALAEVWTAGQDGAGTFGQRVAAVIALWKGSAAERPRYLEFPGWDNSMRYRLAVRGAHRRLDLVSPDGVVRMRNLTTPDGSAALNTLDRTAPMVGVSGSPPPGAPGALGPWPWQWFEQTGFDRILTDPAARADAVLGDPGFRRSVDARAASARLHATVPLSPNAPTVLTTTSSHESRVAYLPVETVQVGTRDTTVTRRAHVWLDYDVHTLPVPKNVLSVRARKVSAASSDLTSGQYAQVSVYAWTLSGIEFAEAGSVADIRLSLPEGTRIVDRAMQPAIMGSVDDAARWPAQWAELMQPPARLAAAVERIRAANRSPTAQAQRQRAREDKEGRRDGDVTRSPLRWMFWAGLSALVAGVLLLVTTRRANHPGRRHRAP